MTAPRPYTLVAELTYSCPLRCVYCSNPVEPASGTLSTRSWIDVLDGATRLGVLQVHFTGGEPLLREDLAALIAHARSRALYTNLITSGATLTEHRLDQLAAAGLDAIQLSIQDVDPDRARRIAGVDMHAHKLAVAAWIAERGMPLTINVVLHRDNLARVADLVALAETLGAGRLELANVQYHGWAFHNRAHLMPTETLVADAHRVARAAAERLLGKMEIVFVKADYFGSRPRACMDGWARRFIIVTPDGRVLPCQAAHAITTLEFDSVNASPLDTIWTESAALRAYRGEAWMPEPCASCDERERDFGGCRCQAFQLAGDAGATDPACARSPRHALVQIARTATPTEPLAYRSSHRTRG